MARSTSGIKSSAFQAEVTGSNPVRATILSVKGVYVIIDV